MGEYVRWDLQVSQETDEAVREILVERGADEADMSQYIEDLVNRLVLEDTIKKVRRRNAASSPADIERDIEQAMAETKKTFWSQRRH